MRPDYQDAYRQRGIIYQRKKQWQPALADFQKLIKLDNNNADAYFNQGFIYIKLEQWNDAIASYDQGIQLNSNDGKAYYNRASAHLKLKDRSKAKADLIQAKKLFQAQGDYRSLQRIERALQQLEWFEPKTREFWQG